MFDMRCFYCQLRITTFFFVVSCKYVKDEHYQLLTTVESRVSIGHYSNTFEGPPSTQQMLRK